MTIALISGTSGLVGMQLLHQLLRNPAYSYVISVGRRSLALKHEKLLQIDGDMPKLTTWAWEDKINAQSLGGAYQNLVLALQEKKVTVHAFCSLGTTIKQAGSKDKFYAVDHGLVLEFASWAKKLGACKVFVCLCRWEQIPNPAIFYNKVKGETEEDLKAIQFDYLGLFRPSLLLGSRHEYRFGEQVATFFMTPFDLAEAWEKYSPHSRPCSGQIFGQCCA